MNIDIFLTKSELFLEKITPVIRALFEICPKNIDFFEAYVIPTLSRMFKDDKVIPQLEDIATKEQNLKENELKIFLSAINLIFKLTFQVSEFTKAYIEKAISGLLKWVKIQEEIILNKQDSLFRGRD